MPGCAPRFRPRITSVSGSLAALYVTNVSVTIRTGETTTSPPVLPGFSPWTWTRLRGHRPQPGSGDQRGSDTHPPHLSHHDPPFSSHSRASFARVCARQRPPIKASVYTLRDEGGHLVDDRIPHPRGRGARGRSIRSGAGRPPRPPRHRRGPTPKKLRAAPAQAIVVGGEVYVVDCGNGVGRQMALAGLPFQRLRAVFLTHHHSDHAADS